MSDFVIHSWVRRDVGAFSLWHLVESDVADAAIVKCGRRMNAKTKRGVALVSRTSRPSMLICSDCNAKARK